jgi:hypothetical protein
MGRLAFTSAVAALALFAAPGAKAAAASANADVPETFNLTGSFGTISGPLAAFSGTVSLDFSGDFATETLTSITISVQGSAFNQSIYLSISPSVGFIEASDGSGDTLELWFAGPQSGTGLASTRAMFPLVRCFLVMRPEL